jgi:TRAP-type C4-dicarboxylate transport system substrate-binding protein
MTVSKSRLAFGAAVIAAGAMTLSSAAMAQKVNWNMSVWGKSRAFTKGIEALAEEVSNRTDGNFKIKIHYGEALSKSKENLDGIKLGAFQMAAFCASYHPNKTPTVAALDLPFLPLGNLDIMERVHEKFFQHPAVVEDLKRWNAMYAMSGMLPQYEFMGVGEPPMKLADWTGKRVRALGGIGKAMAKLGAVPTTVPAPETYQLLERGAVDGVSWPFTYAHAAYKVDEISKWFTGNMSPGAVTCPIVANINAWNKLPQNYKDAFQASKAPAYAKLKAAYKAADDKNLPKFRAKMKEIIYTDAQLDEFRAVGAKPVWDDWIKDASGNGVPAQELLDLILSEAKR